MSTTDLYFVPFETPSADKITIVVEASSPEEATRIAEGKAIDIGALDESEIGDDDSECYFLAPIRIEPVQGHPGIRMAES